MKGAIIYKTTYGGTRQYAEWISERTGFGLFDVRENPDIKGFDTLIIGSGVRIGKMIIADWLAKNKDDMKNKTVIIFSVGGHPSSNTEEINKIIENSIPKDLKHRYFPLQGRMNRNLLGIVPRIFFTIASRLNYEFKAMIDGFDFIKKENIKPILDAIPTKG